MNGEKNPMNEFIEDVPYCGPCANCGLPGIRTRQNTSYNNDELNYATLCPRCQEENDAHWAAMWEEYNRGRL